MEEIIVSQKTRSLQQIQLGSKDAFFCAYIDDFYRVFGADGCPKGTIKQMKALDTIINVPKSLEQAQIIAHIYEETYQGTYPFKEMLDVAWILAKFADPNYIWGILQVSPEHQNGGEIVGCFTIVLDFEHDTGYLRGLMIRPKFQKLVNVREMSFAMTWHAYDKANGQIHKWFCEARTAHSISQYLMTAIGSHVHAVFFNKDYFFGKKESDALMVAYTSDVLEKARNEPLYLIPDALTVYEHIRELHGLNAVGGFYDDVYLNSEEVQSILQRLNFKTETDSHGYETITIYDPTNSHLSLTGLHTPMVHNLEKIAYIVNSLEELAAMILFLLTFTKVKQIEYVEWWISANRPEHQKLLKNMGFSVFGYVPAWINAENQKCDDAVVFGYSKIMPQFDQIQLIHQGTHFLKQLF